MAIPDPLIQFRNAFPFDPACGSRFVKQTPAMQPASLRRLLPCEICIRPALPPTVTPDECLQQYTDETGRTAAWSSQIIIQITDSTVDGIDDGTVIVLNYQDAPSGSCPAGVCCELVYFVAGSSKLWSTRTSGSLDEEWLNIEFPGIPDCGTKADGMKWGVAIHCYRVEDSPGSGTYHSELVFVLAWQAIGSDCGDNGDMAVEVDGNSTPASGLASFNLPISADPIDVTVSGRVLCGVTEVGTMTIRISE